MCHVSSRPSYAWILRSNKWILGSFSCPYCHLLLMKFGIKMYCHEECVAYHHDLHVTLSYHICWFLWCLTPLSTNFNYIMAVSFIGGGIFQTCRKPPTNFILDPKSHTIVFKHISEPSLYQVSSNYRFQEQNSILYDQDKYHVRSC